MFCPDCGTEIPHNYDTCPKCGQSVYGKSPLPPHNAYEDKSETIVSWIRGGVGLLCAIIFLIICIKINSMPKEELAGIVHDVAQDVAQEFAQDYITPIKNDTPAGYSTTETYGHAFSRFFSNGKWDSSMNNSDPIVTFTGICDNQDGTYSKAEVVFSITDMGDNFYYNIDSVVIDGLDLGVLGIAGFMEAVFN
jgi:hypothetical protein